MTDSEIENLQMQIDALKNEVKGLKEFVRSLYTMITSEDEEYDASDYLGGAEVGRFNT